MIGPARLPPDAIAPGTLDDLVATFGARGEHHAVLTLAPDGALAAVTYSRLYDEVSRLARGIAELCSAGDFVLLWAPNGAPWITAYLGTVAAGAVVIPLDDQSGAQGLAVVLAQNRPAAVLSVSAHVGELRRAGIAGQAIFLLDGADGAEGARSWQALLRGPGSEVSRVARGERVAVLLYTSGTTGTPKGVPLTHGNLLSNVRGLLAAGVVRDTDRVLLPLPLHHAYAATVGMLTVLASGATIVLPAGISGPELAAAAERARATILVGVPRLYESLLESIAAALAVRGAAARLIFRILLPVAGALRRATGINLGRVAFRSVHRRLGGSLRTLACGGALLDPDAARRLEAIGWCVLTGYGLTETSPVVTFNAPRRRRLATQGRPLAGVDIRCSAQADGGPGEIQVRGPNVFAGYWREPAASQRAFAEGGWFRTGDGGYIDSDGYLHVLGRQSDVIVLPDGKKIAPEELERHFEQGPYIREAALLAPHGELLALVVPDEDAVRARGTMSQQNLLHDELEAVNATLPSWQRLRGYRVIRQDLPRTRLGKLRRHLLPALYEAPAGAPPRAARAAVTPADERLLAHPRVRPVWQWLTGRFPGVTPDSSPQLDLGIDSLGWVTLTAELAERFGVVLGSAELSRVLTVRDLLAAVAACEPRRDGTHPVPEADDAHRYIEIPGYGHRPLGALVMGCVRLLMMGPYRLQVAGRANLPAHGAFVLAPNHSSYLDPLAVAAALPPSVRRRTCWAGWAGKTHNGALARAASRALRVFPVAADVDLGRSLRLGAEALAAGDILVWFPEGRRSLTGQLQPFRPGLGVLLDRVPVPVVPVRIDGTFAAWPPGRRWPRLRRLSVTFGVPRTPDWMNAHGRGPDAAARIGDVIAREIAGLARTGASRRRTGA